jgi:diguanylate cyclase (GGDEF)-like protein
LLCRRTEKQESILIAKKIRESIEAHAFKGVTTERISVTVSIGAVSFLDGTEGATEEDYIHCADLALYRSKAAGRNQVTHYADMAGVTS